MSAIIVVMIVAVCEPGLLICAPTLTWQQTWENTEDCRSDRNRVMQYVRVRAGDGKTVMSRCRYFVDEGYRFQQSLPARLASTLPTS